MPVSLRIKTLNCSGCWAPIRFMGWHLHSKFEHLHLSAFQEEMHHLLLLSVLHPFAFPGGLILFHQDFYARGTVFPEAKNKKKTNFPPMHRHIPSVLMHVLCQPVKLLCVTVYTSTRRTGLGCKRNALILVPFANRGKLLHMSSGSEFLV